MTAQRIDGVAVARQVHADSARRVKALAARGIHPKLAVVVVGDEAASRVYVRNKERACAETGVGSVRMAFDADVPAATVLRCISQLNADPGVHGVLVQLPLPAHFAVDAIVSAIAPEKDVDGFRTDNLGAVMAGTPGFAPCTPSGVLALLDAYDIALDGREAVVVGRSTIVGKPLALMLVDRGATVTLCHSRSRPLGELTRRADVLVVATGRAGLVTGDMVKRGAAVIDVGINRLADGRLVGDVDFDGVAAVAGHLTPVPGGVGPMTVAALIANTVKAAERAHEEAPVHAVHT